MRRVLAFAQAIDRASRTTGRLVAWLLLLTVLISSTNAVSRKLFDLSANAWLELQWTLFSAVFLLGAAYTLSANEHVRMDILYNRASPRLRAVIDLVGGLLFLLPFTGVVLYYAWPFFLESWRSGEWSSNPGGLVLWPGKLLVPLGFFLLFLQALAEIVQRAAFLAGLMPEPPPAHSPLADDMILTNGEEK